MNRKRLILSKILLGLMVVFAIGAEFIAPYDPLTQHRQHPSARPGFSTRNNPMRWMVQGEPYHWLGLIPSTRHLFGADEPARVFLLGTDALGRDVFSRIIYGTRLALLLLAAVLLIALPLALVVGSIAGFYGGWIDFVCMRALELLLSLPALYLIIALRAALPLRLPPTQIFIALVLVIALLGWAYLARIVRGATLALRTQDFVVAARSLGASDAHIILRHLWPNLAGIALTQAAMAAPGFLLAEVTLSFLGLGLPDSLPSWGTMLASVGGVYQLSAHWWNLAPAVALWVTSLIFSSLAEGLRESYDPRTNGYADSAQMW